MLGDPIAVEVVDRERDRAADIAADLLAEGVVDKLSLFRVIQLGRGQPSDVVLYSRSLIRTHEPNLEVRWT